MFPTEKSLVHISLEPTSWLLALRAAISSISARGLAQFECLVDTKDVLVRR